VHKQMLLVYCDKCGFRISDDDLKRGNASCVGENRYNCAKCAPPDPASLPRRPKTTPAEVRVPLHSGTAHAGSSASGVRHVNAAKKNSAARASAFPIRLPLPALAGIGLATLAVMIWLLMPNRKNDIAIAPSAPATDRVPAPGTELGSTAGPAPADSSARKDAPLDLAKRQAPPPGEEPAPQALVNAAGKDEAMGKPAGITGPSWMQNIDVRRDKGEPQPKFNDQRDEGNETVFFDDALPPHAVENGTASVRWISWKWQSAPAPVFSGKFAHCTSGDPVEKVHQHYFDSAYPPLRIFPRDTLFAYVYLDPAAPPKEIMLQWNDGTWDHRAYWGENLIPFGTDGTANRHPMGALPEPGEWVRLEVPAELVGLTAPLVSISGCSFDHYGGRVYWDKSGVVRKDGAPPPAPPMKEAKPGESTFPPVVISGQLSLGKIPWNAMQGGQEFLNFANRRFNSRAIWARPTPLNALSISFSAPAPRYGAGTLVLTTLRHDRPQSCRMALEVNGSTIFDGEDPATTQDWVEQRFPVPEGLIKTGANTIRILNMEENGKLHQSPWLMLNAAELFAAPAQ
jgi:hypothetical protein